MITPLRFTLEPELVGQRFDLLQRRIVPKVRPNATNVKIAHKNAKIDP